jgi:cell division protein FtsN
MQVKRILASAVIAASMGIGFVQAQDLADVEVPAEFPPSSYEGRQYVDSRGCVYVRAGIDGNTSWVPRVSRDRKAICGFKPTLAGQPAAKTQTASAPTAKPEQIEVQPAPQPKAQPAQQRTAQTRVVKRPAQAKTAPRVTKPTTTKTAPKTIKVVRRFVKAPEPKPKMQPKRTAKTVTAPEGQPACQGASAISREYYRTAPGVAVRCGPQATPHAWVVQSRSARANAMRAPRGAQVATYNSAQATRQPEVRSAAPRTRRTATTSGLRVAPRHVYQTQKNSTVGISVPDGYKRVWDDDRLNTKRAHQTLTGKAQMEVGWSKTVPRYLINRNTGRDITYMYPGLQYPYTSFEAQRAAGVTIATRGRVTQLPQRVVRTSRGATVSTRQTAPRTTTVSTRSASPEATQVKRATKAAPQKKMVRKAARPYVQIGAFRDAGQAQRAAQRLANSGLPTRMGRVTRGGESFAMVKVGPFRTQPQLDRALRKVRRKGYGQARPSH